MSADLLFRLRKKAMGQGHGETSVLVTEQELGRGTVSGLKKN
jgi:hypothetical protein